MQTTGDRAGSPAPGAARAILLAARFASELALLAVLATAGAMASISLPGRILLAVAAPVAAAAVWGLLIAPRARRRLRDPARLAAETVIFAAASAALALAGPVIPALVFAIAAIGLAVLARIAAPGS